MLEKVRNYWNIFISHFSAASNRRLLSLLTLVVIVAALPLTVFMAQQQQDLRQRASEVTTPTSPPFVTPTPSPFPTAGPGVCQINIYYRGLFYNHLVDNSNRSLSLPSTTEKRSLVNTATTTVQPQSGFIVSPACFGQLDYTYLQSSIPPTGWQFRYGTGLWDNYNNDPPWDIDSIGVKQYRANIVLGSYFAAIAPSAPDVQTADYFIQFYYHVATGIQSSATGILTGNITSPYLTDVILPVTNKPRFFLHIQPCATTTTCNSVRAGESNYGQNSVGAGEIEIPSSYITSNTSESPNWTQNNTFNSYPIAGLAAGTQYAFRIRQHGAGTDAYIPGNTFTYAPIITPTPVTILSVTPTTVNRNGILTVNWSGIPNPNLGDFMNFLSADGRNIGTSHTYWVQNNCAWFKPSSGTLKSSGSCTIDLSKEIFESSTIPGPYNLVLYSGSGALIIAKSNNFTIVAPIPTPTPTILLPDLVIEDIYQGGKEPGTSSDHIYARYKNTGALTSGEFFIKFSTPEVAIDPKLGFSVPPTNVSTRTRGVNINQLKLSPGETRTIKVNIDVFNNIQETNETNNIVSKSITVILPTVTVSEPIQNSTVSSSGFRFAGTAQANPSNLASVTEVRVRVYDVARATATVNNVLATYNPADKKWYFNVLPGRITPGSKAELRVRAKDNLGNWSPWSNKIIVNISQ